MNVIKDLPPLRSRKRPLVALIVGFLAGGLGLAIYFRSLLDGLVSFFVAVSLATQIQGGALIAAAIVGGWGYVRAVNSNLRLEAAVTTPAETVFTSAQRV